MTAWTREHQRAVQGFVKTEAGGASLLLAATLIALVWANSPLSDLYEDLWHTELTLRLGDLQLSEDLRHWVNDGLMVFFFFLVGMEVRRELSMGELTDRQRALVPAAAALGGMVVPALVFLAFNAGGDGAGGWGIVMATDIAFVVGLLALVAPNAPHSLRVFLLTLAIVDDIGAIVVIAVFYSTGVDLVALGVAAAMLPVILLINRVNAWRGPAYFVAGAILWGAMFQSGVHPTIAGVLVGVLVAVHPPRRADVELAARLGGLLRQAPTPQLQRLTKLGVADAVSPNERLQTLWHPWTSYVIIPVFALANAGVVLDADALDRALGSPVTLGVVAGLVAGKLAGIVLTTGAVVRLGVGPMPEGVRPPQLVGGAALAGIGFTVALFITDLAFDDQQLQDEAKAGVLAGSLLAALLATLVFRVAARGEPEGEQGPPRLAHEVRADLDHVRGPADAPLTLLEYGDYECEHCAAAADAVDELLERMDGQVRFVWRHLPLEDVHPGAMLAAEAAEAAAAQDRFWEMHDRLIRDEEELDLSRLIDHAQALGLDLDRFLDDMQEHAYSGRIRLNVRGAEDSDVQGTPTFFVNGVRHDAGWDAGALASALRGDRVPV